MFCARHHVARRWWKIHPAQHLANSHSGCQLHQCQSTLLNHFWLFFWFLGCYLEYPASGPPFCTSPGSFASSYWMFLGFTQLYVLSKCRTKLPFLGAVKLNSFCMMRDAGRIWSVPPSSVRKQQLSMMSKPPSTNMLHAASSLGSRDNVCSSTQPAFRKSSEPGFATKAAARAATNSSFSASPPRKEGSFSGEMYSRSRAGVWSTGMNWSFSTIRGGSSGVTTFISAWSAHGALTSKTFSMIPG